MGKISGLLKLGLVLSLISCAPLRADDASQLRDKLNGGYYLLHTLGGDEAQLPLLLDIKHAPPELEVYADRVSKTGKETGALIEKFGEENHGIHYDRNPLPAIEQDVRDSIKAGKQHQLVFGTKDNEFVRALLISQIEASTYGSNLCKVLAEQEPNHARAEKLHHLGAKWLERRDEAFRMLRDY